MVIRGEQAIKDEWHLSIPAPHETVTYDLFAFFPLFLISVFNLFLIFLILLSLTDLFYRATYKRHSFSKKNTLNIEGKTIDSLKPSYTKVTSISFICFYINFKF